MQSQVDASNDVDILHRIGQRPHHDVTTASQRPRQVIVKLSSHKIKQKVMIANNWLQDLKKCQKVEKCWSIAGKIKYKLRGHQNVCMSRISHFQQCPSCRHYLGICSRFNSRGGALKFFTAQELGIGLPRGI